MVQPKPDQPDRLLWPFSRVGSLSIQQTHHIIVNAMENQLIINVTNGNYYTYMHAHAPTHTHAHAHVRTRSHAHTDTHTQTHRHTHKHTHTQTHTHTHTHTRNYGDITLLYFNHT